MNYIFTPLQVDVLYVGFFPFLFLFIYFIMGTCVLVSQVLDSLSFLPFFFFLFFFLILFFCVCITPFLFSIVLGFFFFFLKKNSLGFFKFLSSFYFIFLMKKSFIHIFFNKNIMYYISEERRVGKECVP